MQVCSAHAPRHVKMNTQAWKPDIRRSLNCEDRCQDDEYPEKQKTTESKTPENSCNHWAWAVYNKNTLYTARQNKHFGSRKESDTEILTAHSTPTLGASGEYMHHATSGLAQQLTLRATGYIPQQPRPDGKKNAIGVRSAAAAADRPSLQTRQWKAERSRCNRRPAKLK